MSNLGFMRATWKKKVVGISKQRVRIRRQRDWPPSLSLDIGHDRLDPVVNGSVTLLAASRTAAMVRVGAPGLRGTRW